MTTPHDAQDARKKFATLARKIERDTAKLAASAQSFQCDDARKLYRACDRLSDLVRWVLADVDCLLAVEITHGTQSRLRHAVTAAAEQASKNYQDSLASQSWALEKAARAERKELGGFEHELKTQGVGYGRRYATS